jgi:SAM-dependent methyltransferase
MSTPAFEERRLSFGAAAGAYADYRPGYPREAIAWVFSGAARRVTEVADVGAGTGKLTQTLAEVGTSVDAVEPDPGMLDELRRRVPQVRAHRAPAESLPLDDDSVDEVVVAQAWHWFDQPAATREFARVVRPGGVVGLLWNLRDDSGGGWMADLSDLVEGEDTLRGSRDHHPDLGSQFSAIEEKRFAHSILLDVDSLVALVSTFSFVRLRADADDVYAAVRELVAHHPQTRGRERIDLPYVTATYRAVRL